MKLTIWGAAKQVTGSVFLLELEDDFRVLIDCGMDMGKGQSTDALYPGSAFPFDASTINLVILTHAHLDHSGRIPNLLREGFEGKIICTSPTKELSELLLLDSANINRRKIKYFQKKRSRNPGYKPDFNPDEIYLEKDVNKSLELFLTLPFNKRTKVKKDLLLTLIPTGHLLGAANVLLEVFEGGKSKKIMFSGDVGRSNYPLLPDPQQPEQVDFLVCETTYGNRLHQSKVETEEELRNAIQKTCVDMAGKLIIPAFSIGRTQAIIYTLNKLFSKGNMPSVKIYADSPLARKSNKVYERNTTFLNEEAKDFKDEKGALFYLDNLEYIDDLKESIMISKSNESCIIISSSGMLEGGRIQNHIKENLGNARCTILMVGFSAEGTFGHRLVNSGANVVMGKRTVPVMAKVEHTDAFSGHGDQNDLLQFVEAQSPEELKKVILVHGEPGSMEDFKGLLENKGYQNIHIPEKGEIFEL
ncbi:MAG: MBL fold metallo-hydrolase [Flammeovirgaceae bacterium]|nr:MBL fold metallo-hydrolase [Flammeovirgaceae bacterium]